MDYSPSKQTTKQWHYCQQETEEPVSSRQATKLTCSNNRANRGYRPNHDVAPCRIGSLTTADTVNSGEKLSQRQNTDEKHMYRWKKIETEYQNGK